MDEGKEDGIRVSRKGSHGTRNTIIDGDWLFQPGVSLSNTTDSWIARYRLRRYLSAKHFQRLGCWNRKFNTRIGRVLLHPIEISPNFIYSVKKKERTKSCTHEAYHSNSSILFSHWRAHRKNNRKSNAHKHTRHSTTRRNESRPFASSEQNSTPSFTAKHRMHLEDISTGSIHREWMALERGNDRDRWQSGKVTGIRQELAGNKNPCDETETETSLRLGTRCPTPLSLCRRLAARCPITIYLRVKALASHANGWRALACAAAHEHRRDKFSPRTCTECETMTHRWIILSFAIWRPSPPLLPRNSTFSTREKKFLPRNASKSWLERTLISPLRIEEQDLSTRDLRCSSLLGLKVVIRLKFFVEFTEDWNIVLLKSKIEWRTNWN